MEHNLWLASPMGLANALPQPSPWQGKSRLVGFTPPRWTFVLKCEVRIFAKWWTGCQPVHEQANFSVKRGLLTVVAGEFQLLCMAASAGSWPRTAPWKIRKVNLKDGRRTWKEGTWIGECCLSFPSGTGNCLLHRSPLHGAACNATEIGNTFSIGRIKL